jgi:hypothetical protein
MPTGADEEFFTLPSFQFSRNQNWWRACKGGLTTPTTPAIVGFHGSEANWSGTETIHTVVGSIPTTSKAK